MLRKWYAFTIIGLLAGSITGSAFAFQQTPVAPHVMKGVPAETAQLLGDDFGIKSELIMPDGVTQSGEAENKSWFTGLRAFKLDLDFLYGGDTTNQDFVPEDLSNDPGTEFTIKGTVKKSF